MKPISKYFWWGMLLCSSAASIYQVITTGTADTVHMLTSLISLAVITLSKQQEVTNGLQN